jgi:hypothetical protein
LKMDQKWDRLREHGMRFADRLALDGRHVYQPKDLGVFPKLNEDIQEWLRQNMKGQWHYHINFGDGEFIGRLFHLWFEHETDMIFFKMRWF